MHMQREQAEQEVRQLADAWTAAELRGDNAFLSETLTDDFVGIGPLGFLLTKPQWLARHQSGDLKYQALSLDEIQVRVYPQSAVVVCRQSQEATVRDNPVNVQLRTTLVFVDLQGQWRLAGVHFCNMGQPLPFARN